MRGVRRFRWRLALLIAGEPIMRDPFPGDGAFVVTREGGLIAAFRADSLDVAMEHRLTVRGLDDLESWNPPARYGTFSGTIAR